MEKRHRDALINLKCEAECVLVCFVSMKSIVPLIDSLSTLNSKEHNKTKHEISKETSSHAKPTCDGEFS